MLELNKFFKETKFQAKNYKFLSFLSAKFDKYLKLYTKKLKLRQNFNKIQFLIEKYKKYYFL